SLAIVAGIVDGVRHVLIDRVAGDDVTAVLALVAGAILIMLGTAVLWTSRRRDEPLRRRYGRRALITIAAVVSAYFVVLPVAIAVVVNHKARAPIVAPELGRPHEQVSLRTSDGLELVGWYAPSRNRAAVIVFPGHDGPAPHARMLVRRGYGVLMLDRRGEGESQGDYNARGWGGEPDLEAAISYLAERDDVDSQRIGGLGLSVGGELLIQTAARDGRLAAVVSEGAGNQSLADQMQTPDAPKAVRWLSPMTMETAAGIVLSNRRPPAGLATAIPRIAPRPVLLITGGRGNPDEALNGVYRAAGGPTVSLWEIPEAGHTGGIAAEPGEYERRVVAFFDSALLP
ncbi:MAG TPA: CocE/NonD family hydrolase, partial [Solirubrobacteraceae bacterium]|nr:CocE/NonD family hydrolase [Solirubrobacteraceae bacterium]